MQVMFSSSSTGKPLVPISGVDVLVIGSRLGDKITGRDETPVMVHTDYLG